MSAAKLALALTALMAVVLIAMAVLDADWLGFAVIAIFFAVLIARQVVVSGMRGTLLFTCAIVAVIGVAYVVSRAT